MLEQKCADPQVLMSVIDLQGHFGFIRTQPLIGRNPDQVRADRGNDCLVMVVRRSQLDVNIGVRGGTIDGEEAKVERPV